MSLPRGHALVCALVVFAGGAAAVGIAVWRYEHRYNEPELPEEYRGVANPLEDDHAARDAGARLFSRNCAPCHGPDADGRGPAAPGLNPPPADFRGGPILRNHSDAFLYWRIAEGKHGTAMPQWDGVLTENERWEVIAFLRSLEPD